jgi:hypothetical protein
MYYLNSELGAELLDLLVDFVDALGERGVLLVAFLKFDK